MISSENKNPTALKCAFEKEVEDICLFPIRFEWKSNRRTMISVKQTLPYGWLIRLHPEFANAPKEVIRSLGDYVSHQRKSDWQPVKAFAQHIQPAPRTRKTKAALIPEGKIFNLTQLQQSVADEYFGGDIHVPITWNPRHGQARKRKRRSITFGHYDPVEKLIRIHPALDDDRVDAEFIRFIIYHETLHAIHPPIIKGRRQWFHHAEFRKAERQFADFPQMKTLSAHYLRILPAKLTI